MVEVDVSESTAWPVGTTVGHTDCDDATVITIHSSLSLSHAHHFVTKCEKCDRKHRYQELTHRDISESSHEESR